MPRIYADLPKFKRIHQALMEAARQMDVALSEIDKALGGPRTEADRETLTALRQRTSQLRQQHLDMTRGFVMALEEPDSPTDALAEHPLPWSFFAPATRDTVWGVWTHRREFEWAATVWGEWTARGFTTFRTAEGYNRVIARYATLAHLYKTFCLLAFDTLFEPQDEYAFWMEVLPFIPEEVSSRLAGEEVDTSDPSSVLGSLISQEHKDVVRELKACYGEEGLLFKSMRDTSGQDGILFASFQEILYREKQGIQGELWWDEERALGWITNGMILWP